ncbi:unnamed protein product [Closterium sp. Naga37s-1]|nr:unnamed protein product [Closterium sp. Naga37s-1]
MRKSNPLVTHIELSASSHSAAEKFPHRSLSPVLLVTLASAASLASFATRGLFSATARNRRASSLSRGRDWGESRVSYFRQRFHSQRLTMASAQQYSAEEIHKMSDQEKQDLDRRVQEGETVVKGGTGGKSLEAQLHLAEGRHKGGERGGQARAEQIGSEGYQEMGRKGGLSTTEQSGGEAAAEKGHGSHEGGHATAGGGAQSAAAKHQYSYEEVNKMPADQRKELEKRAEAGETVVKGGTGGKSLDAQLHLAEGRHRGGESRRHR